MSAYPMALAACGMVTSVGLTGPATAAAIRAGVTNPMQTRFLDWGGEFITGHAVAVSGQGCTRVARMAAMALEECLSSFDAPARSAMPLVLCVAERDRPGRPPSFDEELPSEVMRQLSSPLMSPVHLIAEGRAAIVVALNQARTLLFGGNASAVVVAGVDSLLTWPTLSAFERSRRLRTSVNSNGFIPGEAAAAVVLTRASVDGALCCVGLGTSRELATIESEAPLRADGLVRAIRDAAADAGVAADAFDFRITDLSGEQYYFREAALAATRVTRRTTDQSELWHPADCIGEVGAAAGPVALAIAMIAARKRYAPGGTTLCHFSSDNGGRGAVLLQMMGGL